MADFDVPFINYSLEDILRDAGNI
ncbi:hypothetical protein [Chitinophaga sp.]